jgi:hypothetical protein
MRHAALTARAARAGAAVLLVLSTATACSLMGSGAEAVPTGRPESIDDSSPEGAVAGFVAAEASESYDLSYGLLSSADREEIDTVEDWQDRHATEWPMTGGEIGDVAVDGDAATVTTSLQFDPSLDASMGLTPGRGTIRWRVVREGDRWRIAYAEREVEPVYPDDASAEAGVQAWANAREGCDGDAADGAPSELVGDPELLGPLCQGQGDVETGDAARLEGDDAEQFTGVYGGDVTDWARVVPLSSIGGLRIVVAPVGDEWVVIGVLGPTA